MNTQVIGKVQSSEISLADWQELSQQASWRGVVFCRGQWQPRDEVTQEDINDSFSQLAVMLRTLENPSKAVIYSDFYTESDLHTLLIEALPFPLTFTSSKQTKSWLGQEHDLLILHLDTEFSFEAFGQLTGTLKAGGLCLMLMGPKQNIPEKDKKKKIKPSQLWWDHQLDDWLHNSPSEWLVCNVTQQSNRYRLSEHRSQPTTTSFSNDDEPQDTKLVEACVSKEQLLAVQAIKKVALGHRRRPCVIEADRGRGKSASLGIAAAELFAHHRKTTIWVCAHHKRATEQVFIYCREHLQRLGLHEDEIELIQQDDLPTKLQISDSKAQFCAQLKYLAPDALLTALGDEVPDLLLIDEAATLPLPLLMQVVKEANRVVFSTTVHGYEGTGRSFELRFKPALQAQCLGFSSVKITQPARWGYHDPLENLVDRLLLLSAKTLEIPEGYEALSKQRVFCIRSLDFAIYPELLQQSFALLVFAHYKTSPNDLQQMFDNPSFRLFVSFIEYEGKRRVTGCCLLTEEGQLDADLASPIQFGERRIKGHILPQSLAHHCQQPQAIGLRFARIVRIAVLPELKRLGIGSNIMKCVSTITEHAKVDCLGSSFGATAELVSFWRDQGFQPFRLGAKRDSISGEFAVMVLHGHTERAKTLVDHVGRRFSARMQLELPTRYSTLSPPLVAALLNEYPPEQPEDVIEAYRTLSPLVKAGADLDGLFLDLHQLALLALEYADYLPGDWLEVLTVKILQGRTWSAYAEHFGLSGKKEAQQHFREAFCAWVPRGN